MAGLPGTGKTTLARELAHRTQGALLNKDETRAALFAPADIQYSVTQDDFVVEVMIQTARFLLQTNPTRKVFLDGRPFSRRNQIDRVLEFARELAQPGGSSNASVRMNPPAAWTWNPTPSIPRRTDHSRSTLK